MAIGICSYDAAPMLLVIDIVVLICPHGTGPVLCLRKLLEYFESLVAVPSQGQGRANDTAPLSVLSNPQYLIATAMYAQT